MSIQLTSQWSIVHIIGCIAAFAGFAASFVASAGYILQERMLKSKRIGVYQRLLPSLDRADRIACRMVTFGFLMLTVGVIAGSFWSQSEHGTWWNWSSRQIWSLITWLVYAAYLHVRVISRWRGKWANWLLLAGFICLMMTLFGAALIGGAWRACT